MCLAGWLLVRTTSLIIFFPHLPVPLSTYASLGRGCGPEDGWLAVGARHVQLHFSSSSTRPENSPFFPSFLRFGLFLSLTPFHIDLGSANPISGFSLVRRDPT